MLSFDVRLRMYTPQGAPGKLLRPQNIRVVTTRSGMATLPVQFSETVWGALPDYFVVGVEYFHAGVWSEPANGRFIFSSDEVDAKDLAGVKTLTGKQLIPWLLQRNRIPFSTTIKDGKRPFKGSPGLIGANPLVEGQNRGWAPFVDWDFSTSKDSAGNNWADTSVENSFPVGSTAWDMIQWLVESGHAEFSTDGLTAHLWPSGYGNDLTGTSNPVRITHKATSAPIRRSIDEVLTRVTVQGAGSVHASADVPSSLGLGALEGWVQESGIGRVASAQKAANAAVAGSTDIKRELSITYSVVDGPLPWAHYNLGDVVQGRYKGGWANLRLVEMNVSKAQDGEITATVVLGNRFKSAIGKLAARPGSGVSGAQTPPGSDVPSPVDTRDPKAPEGVQVPATGVWSDAGLPVAEVPVSWLPVTDATTDEPIGVGQYEVWGRLDSQPQSRLLGTATVAELDLVLDYPAIWQVKVRAQADNGRWSEFSAEVAVDLPAPTEVLTAPSAPVVTQKAGVIEVRWDGSLSGGMRPQFDHVTAWMSNTETGTYVPVGELRGAGALTLSQEAPDEARWFYFTAVDHLQVSSAASGKDWVVVESAGDRRIPAAPVLSDVTSTGYWSEGVPLASVAAAYTAVTVGVDGDPITVAGYETWGQPVGGEWVSFGFTDDLILSPPTPFTPGTSWLVKVRAQTDVGVWSEFSNTEPVTMALPAFDLDAPAAPVVSSANAVVQVRRTGTVPAWYMQTNVETSATQAGAYTLAGTMIGQSDRLSFSADVGATVWVRLVAVDALGRASSPSTAVSHVVTGIDGDDIIVDSIEGNRIKVGTILVDRLEPNFGDTIDITGNVTITTIASVAADATELAKRIDSRGLSLVTNGNGSMGDDTNFTSTTFDTVDRPTGATGSFNMVTSAGTQNAEELISVDPEKAYEYAFQFKQKSGQGNFYGTITPYDSDGEIITPASYMAQTGTLTELAVTLNPGDTTITLVSSANWNPSGAAHLRGVIFWDYVDGSGKVWPANTYSRNNQFDVYPVGGISGNVLTLNAPWAGPAKPAGTKLSNSSSGGSYLYVGASNKPAPAEWTAYSGIVGPGTHQSGTPSAATNKLPVATAFIRVGFLRNRAPLTAPSLQSFANMTLTEVTTALAAQAAANQALSDATTKSAAAQAAAINAAALDATAKAELAESNAAATASLDATAKANAAKQEAEDAAVAAAELLVEGASQSVIDIAVENAQALADAAQDAAEIAAAADATAKAEAAEANAASDASEKADAAQAAAELAAAQSLALTNAAVEEVQRSFRYSAELGLVIGRVNSPSSLVLTEEGAKLMNGTAAVSTWDQGLFWSKRVQTQSIDLGAHQIEEVGRVPATDTTPEILPTFTAIRVV